MLNSKGNDIVTAAAQTPPSAKKIMMVFQRDANYNQGHQEANVVSQIGKTEE